MIYNTHMKYFTEISISINPMAAEIVSAVLMDEIGCSGVVTQDAIMNDTIVVKEDKNIIKGYYEREIDHNEVTKALKDKRNFLIESGISEENLGSWDTNFKTIQNQDWSTNWKKNWKPQRIGKNIVVCPSWEEYDAQPNDIILVLDPGIAFGTGTHQTTRLCMLALEKYLKKDDIVADIGMGSGILAITAVKLGAKSAVGVDNDETVIETAIENAYKNKIENKCDFYQGTASDAKGQYDFICANILHNVLIEIMPELYNIMKPDAKMVLSGILNEKAENVLKCALSHSLKLVETVVDGEWTGIVVQK